MTTSPHPLSLRPLKAPEMTDTTAGEGIILEAVFEGFEHGQCEKFWEPAWGQIIAKRCAERLAAQPSAGARGEAPFAYAFRYIFEGDLRPTAWDFQKRPKEARDPVAGQHSGVEVVPLYATPAQPDTGDVAALREAAVKAERRLSEVIDDVPDTDLLDWREDRDNLRSALAALSKPNAPGGAALDPTPPAR